MPKVSIGTQAKSVERLRRLIKGAYSKDSRESYARSMGVCPGMIYNYNKRPEDMTFIKLRQYISALGISDEEFIECIRNQ